MAKNLCRACGQDFYRVEMFDAHRARFFITPVPSQDLSGGPCIPAEDLGYVAVGGIWYDPEGLETYRKLAEARSKRSCGA